MRIVLACARCAEEALLRRAAAQAKPSARAKRSGPKAPRSLSSAKFFLISSTAFAHFADFARGIDSYPFRVFGVFSGFAIASLYKPRNTQNTHKKKHCKGNLAVFFPLWEGLLSLLLREQHQPHRLFPCWCRRPERLQDLQAYRRAY